jgi:tetraacyldisaccharide 4'-kinase
LRAPDFWRAGHAGPWPCLLGPLAGLYALGGMVRWASRRSYRADIPVICVGNLVAGGAGKTPVALALAKRLTGRGAEVHLLSRGYGGREPGPLRVEPERHSAREVGDEPLLLAAAAPTWVARDRAAGVRAAEEAGAEVIVMDDGLQNPSVEKSLSLVVIDGAYGFGNRRVMPAGPLREPLGRGLARADALVLIGPDETGAAEAARGVAPRPLALIRAKLVPRATSKALVDARVLAFAGIANPEKFFRSLDDAGVVVAARRVFADHHAYRAGEIAAIEAAAKALDALPVTTATDAARLDAATRARIAVFGIETVFEDGAALDALIEGALGDG